MHSIETGHEGFSRAMEAVLGVTVRPEFSIEQAPAPQRLAPHALTLVADATVSDAAVSPLADSATGRFVLLHDPDGVDEWAGTFRVVVFARCDVELEMLVDPLIHEVAWTWVTDALEELTVAQIGGTVTISSGTSFGTMAERPGDGIVEIRASWTPISPEGDQDPTYTLPEHVHAWIDILSRLAGLPPIPPGVTAMAAHRIRSSSAT